MKYLKRALPGLLILALSFACTSVGGGVGGKWDREVDICIVGFGLAGAAAATEAYNIDPNTKILILEKMNEKMRGGNTIASGQTILIPAEDDLENFKAYIEACNQPNPIPRSYLDWWSAEMAAQLGWIEETMADADYEVGYVGGGPLRWGAMVLEFADLTETGFKGCSASIRPAGSGAYMPGGVFYGFEAAVKKRGIEVAYETPALELIQDPRNGAVLGVMARDRTGKNIRIKANKGVILACGGFENNLDMQRNFHGLDQAATAGTPGNTGDGIRMLTKAGAQLWHMKNQTQSGGFWLGIKTPEYEAAFMRNIRFPGGSWIEIDADGSRFYDEAKAYLRQHMKYKQYGRYQDLPHERALPVHIIFDEKVRTAGTVATTYMAWPVVVEGYEWSADNLKEIEAGWIIKADTIEELAAKIGRSPAVLKATVDRYNTMASGGRDQDFGRDAAQMAPINSPPYYAVPLVPALVATTGGAVRNTRSQALDWDSNPIPNLYTAGELGSYVSNLYQNGIFLSEAILSGRAASQHILGVTASTAAAPRNMSSLNWQTLPDGVYSGEGKSASASYTVNATLKGGKIVTIEIVQGEANMFSSPAQRQEFIDLITRTQNLEVDVIAGATQDCQGISGAISEAFSRALK